jgi:hypothetical protein
MLAAQQSNVMPAIPGVQQGGLMGLGGGLTGSGGINLDDLADIISDIAEDTASESSSTAKKKKRDSALAGNLADITGTAFDPENLQAPPQQVFGPRGVMFTGGTLGKEPDRNKLADILALVLNSINAAGRVAAPFI